ncbi:MAG: autoinducer binding domain-containing protein [Rhodobacteraceae bacterium]|nr:autoinducer binding domain-containing protein [Paracoccaceae bacterium]
MTQANEILKRLRRNSPAGFAIGLHVQFTTPRYFFQAYSREWFDTYTAKGFIMHDPIVHWGFMNEGTCLWSALSHDDPLGVLSGAAEFGMKFGIAASVSKLGSRSMAGFARGDREFSEIEASAILRDLRALHTETINMMVLSPEIHETLRHMSIYLAHG